jgi:NADH:ubiquinone oxidoreductase subunit 6 (subunit J)
MDAYDIMLYATYLLAVVGTILSIVMPLLKSLDDPKGLMKSGLGVLGLAVLFFICYFLSGNEVLPKFEGDPFNLTPGLSQLIGGMLVMTYVLSLITIAAILVTELTKAVK